MAAAHQVSSRPIRADARRNHEQLLLAAREVILAEGPAAPLDRIAAAAGVGIATLYRRFGDRDGLFKAVVLDALDRSQRAGEHAVADPDGLYQDGYEALAGYLADLLEIQVSAVIPLVLDRLDPDDPELADARAGSAKAMQDLIDRAHADGSLAAHISFADIGTLMVRLSRPLPGTFPDQVEHDLTRRHLAIVLAGLRTATADTLGRAGMTHAELTRSNARASMDGTD